MTEIKFSERVVKSELKGGGKNYPLPPPKNYYYYL